jgi:DNA recombination protein RmuC
MDTTTLILLSIAIGGVVLAILLVRIAAELRALRSLTQTDDSTAGLLVLQGQLDALRDQVRKSLEGGRLEIDRRLEDTNRVVGEVRRGLGEVDRQVQSVSAVARDLRGLQELLRSPKVRGGMGELMLGELLDQVLPRANFALQYEFSGGERVDSFRWRTSDGCARPPVSRTTSRSAPRGAPSASTCDATSTPSPNATSARVRERTSSP